MPVSPDQPPPSAHSAAKVTLYSVPWCGWCHRASAWLDHHGIDYEEIRVADFQPMRSEVIEVSNQMEVPVIVVELGGARHTFLDETDQGLHELLGVEA